ncbi:MAG TPA: glycosyltransferase [Candidatus Angelobacter sp.]|nr:glycosyltransferase [Candidatus Angelobacter sp.]
MIPAKNEARLLPTLLNSLCDQDYPLMKSTRVYVADAGSTDGTQELAMSFAGRLDIEIIPGGLPSVGRNAGARLATTPYTLFIDADMELRDRTQLRRAMDLAERRKLHCVTTNIWCSQGTFGDHLLYLANNVAQYGSLLVKPFSTGMFMLFDKAMFDQLGGFHEQALYAEDYLLSKKVRNRRFGIVSGCIHTTNRRFRSMGHIKTVGMFLKTMLNSWNDNYFLHDHGYWRQKV